MRSRLFRFTAATLLAAFLVGGSLVDVAEACPLCKVANEENGAQAKAYMYSILFMLAVPGMIFGGLTAGLIRLGYQEARAMKEHDLDQMHSAPQPSAEPELHEHHQPKV